MIDWLLIRHFAITSEVELELAPGFTAITGETGSGKSLLVDALGILLGARAEQGLIRQDMDHAEIQGGFRIPESSPVLSLLVEWDIECADELILRRIIRRERTGRNYINGIPVNTSRLREVGNLLIDIHGQQDHLSLLQKSVQQTLLDEAADNADLLIQLSSAWDDLRETDRMLARIDSEQQGVLERIELLQFQLEELDKLNPGEGEWQNLAQQQKRLSHAVELAQTMESAINRLYEDDHSIQEQLNRLAEELRQLETYEPDLGNIANMLEEAEVNVQEAVAQIRECSRGADSDPNDLQDIENRMSAWHSISRKHRMLPETLADHHSHLKDTLQRLNHPRDERESLEQKKSDLEATCNRLADEISVNRQNTAPELSRKITGIMQELGMQHGRFEVCLDNGRQGSLSRTGWETVSFLVSPHTGMELQPLNRIASGGEISRISLAIQVILADAARVPTMIFDEVDVGIGGTVANVVGERLRELGRTRQVISVTHLPQVASRANHQYSVVKREEEEQVTVALTLLDRNDRIAEIARMSGGSKSSDAATDHARQMLETGDPDALTDCPIPVS